MYFCLGMYCYLNHFLNSSKFVIYGVFSIFLLIACVSFWNDIDTVLLLYFFFMQLMCVQ